MVAVEQPMTQHWQDRWLTARDGLKLHVRHYHAARNPAAPSVRRPVLCLPGLTRNARDFHALASFLSTGGDEARAVYTLDARGRGRSDHDSDPKNYNLGVEMHDVIDTMIALGLEGATIIGTSRGGLVTMMLGAAQPTFIGAVVLNDIGPVIERAGLLRIASYVGRGAPPATWAEAAAAVRRIDGRDFTDIPDTKWEAIARQRFADIDGRPAAGYDPKLAATVSVTEDSPIPALWPQFLALRHVPILAVRGANSDLLSTETLAAMAAKHGRLETLTVPGQGHAPLLDDATTMQAIKDFLERAAQPAHV